MFEEYGLDKESTAILLTYSLVAALILTGSYFYLTNTQSMEIIFEKEPLAPGEVSRLQVVKGDQKVEDAKVKVGEYRIGKTSSEGIKSFEALQEDFKVNVYKGGEKVVKTMDVSEEEEGEINQNFGEVG